MKKVKKLLKKYLTNGKLCDIVEKLSTKRQRAWSLKIEQQKRERKACVRNHNMRNLDNSCAVTNHGDCREKILLLKSKKSETELNFKQILSPQGVNIQNLESLILAQDERWRRA